MDKESFAKELNLKHTIFDTNLFISSFRSNSSFLSLLQFISENNCTIVGHKLIKTEFMRDAALSENKDKRQEFYEQITSNLELHDHPSLYEDAINISRIYVHNGIQTKQISLCDSVIAALLKRHSDRLFLITMDHNDFPILLFDRKLIFTIDDGKRIYTPAFYQFNGDKYQKLYAKLQNIKSPA
jgi:predicted nucleic acid-binding protein